MGRKGLPDVWDTWGGNGIYGDILSRIPTNRGNGFPAALKVMLVVLTGEFRSDQ